MKKILEKILVAIAAHWVQRYKPIIIGVTGNAGKSSTKAAIAAVLHGRHWKVKTAAGNLNTELGFALTIMGGKWVDRQYYERGFTFANWFFLLVTGVLFTIIGISNFPDIFILEYGADHPGDIKRLVQKFPPHISVVTTVGDIPVHVEFFKDAEEVAEEKANLVKILKHADHAVLNQDDHRVLAMRSKTKAHVLTYGFGDGATIRTSDFEYRIGNDKPTGVTFKLHHAPSFVPVVLEGSLGKSQAYAAAAAASVGTILGMNLVQISDALRAYHGPKGRLRIIDGIKGSTIIDDTYNASPASTRLALETLRDLAGSRKVAVLGNMLELGNYSERAHREIGELVPSCADVLVAIGEHTRVLADAAKLSLGDKVYWFPDADAAKDIIREHINKRDLILVKGSQGARMEKIVAHIMARPEEAKKLLVRQSHRWLGK